MVNYIFNRTSVTIGDTPWRVAAMVSGSKPVEAPTELPRYNVIAPKSLLFRIRVKGQDDDVFVGSTEYRRILAKIDGFPLRTFTVGENQLPNSAGFSVVHSVLSKDVYSQMDKTYLLEAVQVTLDLHVNSDSEAEPPTLTLKLARQGIIKALDTLRCLFPGVFNMPWIKNDLKFYIYSYTELDRLQEDLAQWPSSGCPTAIQNMKGFIKDVDANGNITLPWKFPNNFRSLCDDPQIFTAYVYCMGAIENAHRRKEWIPQRYLWYLLGFALSHKDYSFMAQMVNKIGRELGVPRSGLRITTRAGGLVRGPVGILYREIQKDGSLIASAKVPGGLLIPDVTSIDGVFYDMGHDQNDHGPTICLIVESDAAATPLAALLDRDQWRNKLIIVSGSGQPTANIRLFIRILKRAFPRMRFCIVTDCDAPGLCIAQSYRGYGGRHSVAQASGMVGGDFEVKHLGLCSEDLEEWLDVLSIREMSEEEVNWARQYLQNGLKGTLQREDATDNDDSDDDDDNLNAEGDGLSRASIDKSQHKRSMELMLKEGKNASLCSLGLHNSPGTKTSTLVMYVEKKMTIHMESSTGPMPQEDELEFSHSESKRVQKLVLKERFKRLMEAAGGNKELIKELLDDKCEQQRLE